MLYFMGRAKETKTYCSKFYAFIAFITIIKIILMSICSSDYQDKLFLPFVMDFVNNGGNVYDRFYLKGINNAFPYPPVMLLIQSISGVIIKTFKITNYAGVNFVFKLPSFIIDVVSVYFLGKIYSDKRRYVAVFYYASPIVIYAVYMHGQLDIIPTMLMLFAICILASKKEHRYLMGTILTIAALLCKLHILAVIPIVVMYIWNRDGIKKALTYGICVCCGTILGMLPFMSEGFIKCVLLNTEQSVLTQVTFDFATVKLYIPIVAVLIIYLLCFKLNFINQALFINLCSMVFAVFLVVCPPMPGWYIWIVPYIAIFFARIDEEKYKNIVIYIFLNLVYLIYFICLHRRVYVDLYVCRMDCSFLKIENQDMVNFFFTLMSGTLIYIVFSMYKLGIASNTLYKRKNTPFTLGIAGDSGAGKSTMISIVEKCLGTKNLLFIEGDGDHRWERGDEYWNNYTALNPKANYLYRQADDLKQLRAGSSVRRVDYDHNTGKFTEKRKIKVKKYLILCGLHSMYLPQTRKNLDLKIYMDADETLRRYWKIQRDISKRGYTKAAIIKQIEERMSDAEKYIYPQKKFADMVVCYYDKTLKDCMADNHEVKMSMKLTVGASINIEPLVDELKLNGILVGFDYSDDLQHQIIDIDADNLEDIKLPIEKIANRIIPQLDEITRENFEQNISGTEGIIILFLLLLISSSMQGG